MLQKKRPFELTNGSCGLIRSSVLCAPAFSAVHSLVGAPCLPVAQYTATEEKKVSKCASKRHCNKGSLVHDDGMSERQGGTETYGSAQPEVREHAEKSELNQITGHLYSWGYRHRGIPRDGMHAVDRCSSQMVGYQDDWLEVSHSVLAFWEKGPLKPCSEAKSTLYYAVCPQEQMTECTLLVKAIASTYEAFKLGRHRHGGLLLQQSIFSFRDPSPGNGSSPWTAPWLGSMAAACASLRDSAPAATDDARYLGGAAEPCTPVPLLVYIVCPSSAPAAMAKAHSRAAEVLQNISLVAQSCQFPQPASLAGEAQVDRKQSTGSRQMQESSTAQTEAPDLHANYRVVVERSDIVDSKQELGAVLIQMVSQEMLLDITGESARRLALLTYHRLLQASVKQQAS